MCAWEAGGVFEGAAGELMFFYVLFRKSAPRFARKKLSLFPKINYYFCGGFENDSDIIFCKKLKKENKLKIDICEISTPQFIKKFISLSAVINTKKN